jgi:hypothetical protein
MNLVQLRVDWTDNLIHKHTIIRPLAGTETNEWVSGWFSAITEMISFKGGRITSFAHEDVK